MFEPTSHRSRLSGPVEACVCERIAQVELVAQGYPRMGTLEASTEQANSRLAQLSIEGRAGTLQIHEMSDSERCDVVQRIGRVVARIRCAGVNLNEAQRRCSEALLRVTEGPSNVMQVRCEFPPHDSSEHATDAITALDGVSIEAWIASDRIERLSARTSGGDLLHGAFTRGALELETAGGRLDVVSHRGELRAFNLAGRVLLHRVSGRIEVRSRCGDIVVRTARDAVPSDSCPHGTASIVVCADDGDIDLDLRSGWHSAGRIAVFEGRSGASASRSIQHAAGSSEAILVAPRGSVIVSPRTGG